MRAVLDANVLVSGLIARTGPPARLLELWLDGAFELVVSPQLLAETRKTLAAPKLRDRVTTEDAAELLELLEQRGESVDDPSAPPQQRSADPDDDYLLALAAAADAHLVSGDRHLLDLAESAPVFTPRAFLDLLT